MNEYANVWRYDEQRRTDTCRVLAFTAERAAVYRGHRYRVGDEVRIELPRPIERATLDDMAGQGGPWGWGGFTARQLRALEAGKF